MEGKRGPRLADWCEVKVEGAAVLLFQPSRLINSLLFTCSLTNLQQQIIHFPPLRLIFLKSLLFYLPFLQV